MWDFKCVVLILSYIFIIEAAQLPTYLNQCPEKSSKLNKCIETNANLAIRDIIKGDIHYDIPNMNPLRYLNPVTIDDKGYSITFHDILLYGLEKTKVFNVYLDLKKKTFKMDLVIPTLIIFGHYETRGSFFGVDIWHSGEFIKNLTKVQIQYSNTFKLKTIEDNQFFQINSNKSSIKFQKATINLKGLFDENNYVVSGTGSSLYDAFVLKIQEFIEERSKQLNQKISQFITNIFDGIFLRVPRANFFSQTETNCSSNTSKENEDDGEEEKPNNSLITIFPKFDFEK